MPELPDIAAYMIALESRILGQPLRSVTLNSAFVLRTADPPIASLEERFVRRIHRLGKRIALGFEEDLWLVIHLMISGRLHWKPAHARPSRTNLAELHFPTGVLTLTEAGKRHRASLHVMAGEEGLRTLDPGGIDVLAASLDAFRAALTAENHTLKRALTDPRVLSGIGNAYSDEILHAAGMSPLAQTAKLTDDEWRRLYTATRETLRMWIDRLVAEAGEFFPEKVTAFRADMAVHGRFGQPCPKCGSEVQRIRYADNETNYCPTCQTGGKVLADRSLSRLLGSDWPRTLEALESLKAR